MSNYTYPASDDLSDKDALSAGDPEKLILGSDLEAEFQAIVTAIASKYDATDLATQAQAEDGTSNAVLMTPLRVAQALAQNGGLLTDIQGLADPGADRILFWDDGAGTVAFLTAGTGLSLSGTTLSADDANIAHDFLSGFVADEHIAHSGVTLTAGEGLSGGGDISASRSFALNVNGLTAESTLDTAADYVPIYDADAGAHRKTLLSNLVSQSAVKSGRWTRSASQAISASTDATIIYNSAAHSTIAKGTFSTAAGTYTASEAVTVVVNAGVQVSSQPIDSSMTVQVQVNGATVAAETMLVIAGVGAVTMSCSISVPLSLSTNDVVRVRVSPSNDAMTVAGNAATYIGIVEIA